MILYRCNKQGSGNNYAETYTVKVGTTLYKTRARTIGSVYDKTTFNQAVTIGNNVYNIPSLFSGCTAFNQPVVIPSPVGSCAYMFSGCSSLNQPVTFPTMVGNAIQIFLDCTAFNQSVTLNGASYAWRAFENCTSLNRDITVSNITNCGNMFMNCTSLNSQISLTNVERCEYMFAECTKFNRDIIFPATVMTGGYLFKNCTSFAKNIYFKGTSYRSLSVSNMLVGCNNSLRKNIWFNRALNNCFNNSDWGHSSTLVDDYITWSTMTNGFYNTAYNIYCYYNYSG